MRIIRRRPWVRVLATTVAVLALLGGYAYWCLNRDLPSLQPTAAVINSDAQMTKPQLSWPSTGQAAMRILDTDIAEINGAQKPAPIASAAKVITALVVLDKKPLAKGQQGPMITMTAADVASYQEYAANDGSVVRTLAGEQISEYQMLQTILLPSANNMADSLAIWAYGSLESYAEAANAYVAKLGLKETHIGKDASGLAPDTVSSAEDLVRLGELAMDNPVLAEIVGQSTADGIPVVGTIKNVNFLLGTDGIVGIKTGNTEEAGGVFMSAAQFKVNDKTAVVATSVVGEPSLFAAMKSTLPIIDSVRAGFKSTEVVKAGSTVGAYDLPWGGSVKAYASEDLSLMTWGGKSPLIKNQLKPINPSTAQKSQVVGRVVVPASATNNELSASIKLSSNPTQPSNLWRLTHPF